MELSRLIESLSDAAAYPFATGAVQVRHTHISVVFLAGAFAFKVKKPVDLGFLDFSTLARRRHFCDEEVRLNRRLAPDVYLGVVPVSRSGLGVKMEAPGEPVEWAVKMKRLPEEATLRDRLRRGQVGVGVLETLARRVASFHANAEAGPRVSEFGRFDVVARNVRENLDQVAPRVGAALSRTDLDTLRALTEDALARVRPLIESRARRGVPRDTHGDLRLEHVYLFPESPPPADLVIIDCIEFNKRFRFADPVSDMAFLVMDLLSHGRTELARAFAEEYFRVTGDEGGRSLLPLYVAYRAAVRGKVEVFELSDEVIPEAERAAALGRARAHWLLALTELERTGRGP
jgi:aminoglycoside phosphotransferase family enzyme